MSIYLEILNWSQNKQPFVRDALRRLITSTSISQTDIDELVQLVKKDCGDNSITLNAIPLNTSHIPTISTISGSYPRLISLSNPVNIFCSVGDQSRLLNFYKINLFVKYSA